MMLGLRLLSIPFALCGLSKAEFGNQIASSVPETVTNALFAIDTEEIFKPVVEVDIDIDVFVNEMNLTFFTTTTATCPAIVEETTDVYNDTVISAPTESAKSVISEETTKIIDVVVDQNNNNNTETPLVCSSPTVSEETTKITFNEVDVVDENNNTETPLVCSSPTVEPKKESYLQAFVTWMNDYTPPYPPALIDFDFAFAETVAKVKTVVESMETPSVSKFVTENKKNYQALMTWMDEHPPALIDFTETMVAKVKTVIESAEYPPALCSSPTTVVSPIDATVSTISEIAFSRMKDNLSLVTIEYENYTVPATMTSSEGCVDIDDTEDFEEQVETVFIIVDGRTSQHNSVTLEWDDELVHFDEIACTLLRLVSLGFAAAVAATFVKAVFILCHWFISIYNDDKNLIVADDLSFVSCIEGDAMDHLVPSITNLEEIFFDAHSWVITNTPKAPAPEAPAATKPAEETNLSALFNRIRSDYSEATLPQSTPKGTGASKMHRGNKKMKFIPSSKPVAQALLQVPTMVEATTKSAEEESNEDKGPYRDVDDESLATLESASECSEASSIQNKEVPTMVAAPKPPETTMESAEEESNEDMGPYRDVDDESLATLESASECSEASYERNAQDIEELEQMFNIVSISFPKSEVTSKKEVQQAAIPPRSTEKVSKQQDDIKLAPNPFMKINLKPTTADEARSWVPAERKLEEKESSSHDDIKPAPNPFKNLNLIPTTKNEASSWNVDMEIEEVIFDMEIEEVIFDMEIDDPMDIDDDTDDMEIDDPMDTD